MPSVSIIKQVLSEKQIAAQESGDVKKLFRVRKYVLGKIWISGGFFQRLFENKPT